MTSESFSNSLEADDSWRHRVGRFFLSLVSKWDVFIPREILHDAEGARRARLQIRFGFLGAIFGGAYAALYLAFSHFYGAAIVGICGFVFLGIPFFVRATGDLRGSGNILSATLAVGFTVLSLIEGGMHGHAVAWLVGIPLCALLLATGKDAFVWALVSVGVAIGFGIAHVEGVTFPKLFPPEHALAIDAIGYAGLVPFMAMLGCIFEMTRRRAFSKLEVALSDLHTANSGLRRINDEKNEFLDIAAHDLKNPLAVISGYADLMKKPEGLSLDDVGVFSKEILNSSNRMLDIITNLLDVRAIEEGSMDLGAEPCSVEKIVSQIHQDYTNAAKRKSISLEMLVEEGLPDSKGDPTAIYQVLDNLISNAIKYSPNESSVQIVIRSKKGIIFTEVVDEGPGLSEEDQKKLFKKFSKLTPRPTGGESSNGLGLWIVNRMAESMGGRVYCESKEGEGSTFGLELPRWSESDVVRNKAFFDEEKVMGKNSRVEADDSSDVALSS